MCPRVFWGQIFFSKMFGSVLLFMVLVVTGELFPALAYCQERPISFIYFFMFAALGCLGEFAVMALVKDFGALLAVTGTQPVPGCDIGSQLCPV